MKRTRAFLKSSQQKQLLSSTTTTTVSAHFYLPDECWEHVFKFILNNNNSDDNNNRRYFNSLSVVSKQFHSITNYLKFTLKICNPSRHFLHRLFQRFSNLTSLNFSCYYGKLDALLRQISHFPLNLKSLNLSNKPTIPTNGLRDFSKKITTLTSLTCSNIKYIDSINLFLIADCFPLLEELDLSDPVACEHDSNILDGVEALSLALFKLRKLNLSRHYYINDTLLIQLFKNCKLLEEASFLVCYLLTNAGIAFALRERPNLRSFSICNYGVSNDYDKCYITSQFIASFVSLKRLTCLHLSPLYNSNEFLFSIAKESLPLRKLVLQNWVHNSYDGLFYLLSKSRNIQHLDLQNAKFLNDYYVFELSFFLGDLVSINLSQCKMLTDISLFVLVKNCCSLSEIKMKYTSIGTISVENSNSLMDFVANPRLKSLYLSYNSCLRDKSIIMFASIFPNLELLDLSSCKNISDEGICQVLRRCCKIKHLNLAHCSGVKLLGLNFEVPKLEVLNLSLTKVDDEALFVISKNCCGILQLLLEHCSDVTEKGVKHVVENCTQLREVNLGFCDKVHAKVVDSMVFSRPSLRKITGSLGFHLSDKKRKLFARHGCLVR